jgi:hypothetical protein
MPSCWLSKGGGQPAIEIDPRLAWFPAMMNRSEFPHPVRVFYSVRSIAVIFGRFHFERAFGIPTHTFSSSQAITRKTSGVICAQHHCPVAIPRHWFSGLGSGRRR